jgi:hypothetical protein
MASDADERQLAQEIFARTVEELNLEEDWEEAGRAYNRLMADLVIVANQKGIKVTAVGPETLVTFSKLEGQVTVRVKYDEKNQDVLLLGPSGWGPSPIVYDPIDQKWVSRENEPALPELVRGICLLATA